jgi:hypothetical protein
MIMEYNVRYNNSINKMDLQSKIYDMFAKQQLLFVKIINIYYKFIKLSSVDPYLFQKNIDQMASSRRF